MKEFKAFILRGNVVDLAVGVVIGAAFGAVVNALVKDLITPLVAMPGAVNFGELSLKVGGGTFLYGDFLNVFISFISVSASVFFLVVKPVNALMARRKTEPDVESTTKDCPYCLSAIPLAASRCAFCTSEVAVGSA